MIRFRATMPDRQQLPDTDIFDVLAFVKQEIEVVLTGPADEIGALLRGSRVASCEAEPAKGGVMVGTVELL